MKTTEELKLIDIDELIPYANNARTHSMKLSTTMEKKMRTIIH